MLIGSIAFILGVGLGSTLLLDDLEVKTVKKLKGDD